MGTDEFRSVGLVISVGKLRSVIRCLGVNGRRYWIASDPADALETGAITVGFGGRECTDPLNRAFFRIPIVGEGAGVTPDSIILLLDPAVITSEDRGYHLDKKRFIAECPVDFDEFYSPLKNELLRILHTGE